MVRWVRKVAVVILAISAVLFLRSGSQVPAPDVKTSAKPAVDDRHFIQWMSDCAPAQYINASGVVTYWCTQQANPTDLLAPKGWTAI